MAYITKSLTEIKTNMIFNVISNVTEINDANIGSILDIFLTSIAQEIEEQYEDLDTIYDGSRISTATGTDLEELGLLVGIARSVGEKASGNVSFIRNAVASSDFTISAGTIVSTQPTPGDTQYNFVVTADTLFDAAIVNESHTFIDGIYDYAMDQRFISSITSINGTASAAAYSFIDGTDFDLIEDFDGELQDLTDYDLLNDCETPADWVHSDDADAPTLNAATYKEGSGSLNLIKTSITGTTMTYTFTDASTTDFSETDVGFDLYISDATALGKISSVKLAITDGTIATNNFEVEIDASDLSVGWNFIYLDYTDDDTTETGNPDIANIDIYRIQIETVNATDTFAATDLLIDHLRKMKVYDYKGEIVRFDATGTLPDASSTFNVDYIPLSVEVPAEANEVGSGYNVGVGQITYKVTNISQIDTLYNYDAFTGGIDIETDDELKDRIENASAAANVATADALEYNLKTLSFISNVTIEEKPETTATEEVFVYDNTITNYALRQKVAIDDANFTVGDTTGGSDYTRNTDFQLVDASNELQWLGVSEPTHGNLFYVNYNYNKLGYVNAFCVGRGGALTTSQLSEAQDLVDEKKAAGIVVNVTQPTYVSVAVTATLTIDSDYTSADVISDVEDSIDSYFATLSVGDDVLLAEIIYYIMLIDGVTNCSVTDIGGGGASDYTISSTQVATPGTHIIS